MMRGRYCWLAYGLALAWGAAEAIHFFIVPDVLLTFVCLFSRRHGLICCAFAIVGALAGGAGLYLASVHEPWAVHRMLLHVPAVDAALMERARHAMAQLGGLAMVVGAWAGVPYKLFAGQAAQEGLSLPALLAWTVPARGLRFVLLVLVSHEVAQWLRGMAGRRVMIGVWLLAWAIVYVLYWT